MFTSKLISTSSTKLLKSSQMKIIQEMIYLRLNNSSVANNQKREDPPLEYPSLDTKFDQYRIAYRYRRTLELFRGYLVYQLFSLNFLVNNQAKISEWAQRVLGRRLFKTALKLTAFGHFAGGETADDIRPITKRLQKYGVHAILDYSVESDETDSTSTSQNVDQIHEHNTKKFLECINTSEEVCGIKNLIAIKITALVRPNVLKKFNHFLESVKNSSSFPSLFELFNEESDKEKFLDSFKRIFLNQLEVFSNDDLTEISNLLSRLNRIAQASVSKQIYIMVDAEQSYYQTAINYLATELQRYYNRKKIPHFYGTYQCYLKKSLDSIRNDLNLAEKENYVFAAKLVRGAYMEQERRLAQEYHYNDPINPSYQETSKMYLECLNEVFKSMEKRPLGDVRVMVASHNEDTIRYTIEKMKERQVRRSSSLVSFASLYGMSDYIAFALANSGYKTYKYLPYGPIESLQPYLFRRALENRAVFEKAEKDRRLHLKALQDRMMKSKD